jgi:hypothetical protein
VVFEIPCLVIRKSANSGPNRKAAARAVFRDIKFDTGKLRTMGVVLLASCYFPYLRTLLYLEPWIRGRAR